MGTRLVKVLQSQVLEEGGVSVLFKISRTRTKCISHGLLKSGINFTQEWKQIYTPISWKSAFHFEMYFAFAFSL